MSAIDTAVIPILTPPMLGKEFILTKDAQIVLATWMTLKTMVGETDDPAHAAISAGELEDFFEERKPLTNWQIWIARHECADWRIRYFHNGLSGIKQPAFPFVGLVGDEQVKFKAQTTSIGCGELFLHAFSSTDGLIGYTPLNTDRLFRRIWPVEAEIKWPFPAALTGRMPLELGHALQRLLS